MAGNIAEGRGEPFIIVNYFAFVATRGYLLHFSYKLDLYFADICKMEQVYICAPLIVSLGYLCIHKQFLTSRHSMHLLAMSLGTSFVLTLISIGLKALTFQQIL